MRRPIDYARLEALEQRDREVREETRLRAALTAATGMNRWDLPAPGEFFLEQVREMRS